MVSTLPVLGTIYQPDGENEPELQNRARRGWLSLQQDTSPSVLHSHPPADNTANHQGNSETAV